MTTEEAVNLMRSLGTEMLDPKQCDFVCKVQDGDTLISREPIESFVYCRIAYGEGKGCTLAVPLDHLDGCEASALREQVAGAIRRASERYGFPLRAAA